MKRWLLAALLFGFVLPAHSQVLQSGSVTPNHVVTWTANGVVQDGGTAAAPAGLTSLGIVGAGPSFCQYSAGLTSGAYQQLCFGATTASGATISLQNFGTAPAGAISFVVNGITYAFPGSLSNITLGTTPVIGGVNGECLTVNGAVVGQQTCATSSITALTGDVTATGPGSVAATLATVLGTPGTYGSAVAVPVITINGKGLITNVSTAGVATAAAGLLTGATLAANVVNSSLTQVGTITSGIWQGTVVGSTYGGTGVNNGSATLTMAGNVVTTGTGPTTLGFPSTTATFTFPSASDTLAGIAASQTFTNKTLTSPSIAGGALSGTFSGTPTFSGANFITLANVAQDLTGYSLLGNTSSGSANYAPFTLGSLTLKSSPGASDIVMIQDVSASGQLKQTTVSALSSAGSVGSVNGQTGTVVFQGCNGSGSSVFCAQSGYLNKLRNSSLSSWFHGCVAAACTITTSGGWCAEGIFVVPTGASVTCQRTATNPTGNPTYYSMVITGNTSVTDVTVRFVVESYDAVPLAGNQVTFQLLAKNGTGGTITPTITSKYATGQDSTYSGSDLVATNLQSLTSTSSGVLAYSWSTNANVFNGMSVDIDLGNNFSTSGKTVTLGGGFDLRTTTGAVTGTISAPPTPEIRTQADDVAWNQRFYETTYDNGIAPGAATHTGITMFWFFDSANTHAQAPNATYRVQKRADPAISIWDGAGNANDVSVVNSSATPTWTDANAVTAHIVAGQSSFLLTVSGGGGPYDGFNIQWAADATLTGG